MGRRQVRSVECILVVNSGSSSVKFALYAIESGEIFCRGSIDWSGVGDQNTLLLRSPSIADSSIAVKVSSHRDAVAEAIRCMSEWSRQKLACDPKLLAVGHRIVHGGTLFRESVLIDDSVKRAINDLAPLAPLHNPAALQAIFASETELPGIPQVAVFDTAFFASMPEKAFVYPLPYEWFSDWGIRRFGFHGINHSYCAQQASALLGVPAEKLRLIICHLGNGCSASAVVGGKPIATSMGFTPLDGLMMGTRPGSIDPGILVSTLREQALTIDELDRLLNHGSGLLGVSGISSDVRQLETASAAGNARASLALSIFCDRVRSTIGGLAVTLGGVDALVFTAGIGENSSLQRATICEGLGCLGLHLDASRNANAKPDVDIAIQQSTARIMIIESQENLMIARDTIKFLYFGQVTRPGCNVRML